MQIGPLPTEARWFGYVLAVIVTAAATGVSALLVRHVAPTNLAMVYLLGVTFVASFTSPGPAILSALLGVATFDFYFVEPSGTFAVNDVEYLFTFAVMLVVSLLISTLTVRLQDQSKARNEAAIRVQVERMRGDLLSGASHDLRTPLASIEGSAEALLRQSELSPLSRQLAGTVHEESLRMTRLISNLLDMTRVQGVIDLNFDWYGLDELIANAMQRTESMFNNRIHAVIPSETPLAWVDGVLIEQVFVNLLENAARHAGAGAHVKIVVAVSEENLMITVSDDGPGVPPDLGDSIFDRFTGTGTDGFGLGLSICRAAINAHKGRIDVRNLEVGAEFTIVLPIKEGSRRA